MAEPAQVVPDGFTLSDETFGATCEFTANEGHGKNGRLGRLTWTFQTADFVNRNNRIYPGPVVAMAVNELSERIDKNVVFGNLDHPSIFDPDALTVRLSDAAVKVSEVTMTSKTEVRVVVDILDNEEGRQLVSILAVEGNPGVSQRAIARWREPTDAEREKFGIPDDRLVDVAESLRLITYDVVSEPGFPDAEGAKVTESKQGDPQMPMNTPADVKAQNPALYALIMAEGTTAAVAENEAATESAVATAIEAKTPEIVKPFEEKLATAEADKQEALEALALIKPLMEKLGIVDEKITDAGAAAKVAKAEAKAEALEAEKVDLTARLATATAATEALGKIQRQRAAMEAVSAAYTKHPGHDLILKQVAPMGHEDKTKALEAAKSIADLLEAANPAMKIGGDARPDPVPHIGSLLGGLLHENAENPGHDNGTQPTPPGDNKTKADEALALAVVGAQPLSL